MNLPNKPSIAGSIVFFLVEKYFNTIVALILPNMPNILTTCFGFETATSNTLLKHLNGVGW